MIIPQFSPRNSTRQHPTISLKDEMTKSIRFRLSFSQSYLYNIPQLLHLQGRISSRLIPSFSSLHSGPSSLVSAMTQQSQGGVTKGASRTPHPHPACVLGGTSILCSWTPPPFTPSFPFTIRKPEATPQKAVFCLYHLRKNAPKDVLGFFLIGTSVSKMDSTFLTKISMI